MSAKEKVRATIWEETALWSALAKNPSPPANAIRVTLGEWMPKIQSILSSAGTSPQSFTLHDASHSFRVAERMVELIPSRVLPRLSSYELSLLLLSAYLHDIGMTPEQNRVQLHYEFLLTGAETPMTAEEREDFLAWLDEDGQIVNPPICKTAPSPSDLALARELTAYYCRHKHNDWSGAWMREHLANVTLHTYKHWLADLILLCRSHHAGKNELLKEDFNPRHVGSPAQIVHLRYLACVLRGVRDEKVTFRAKLDDF